MEKLRSVVSINIKDVDKDAYRKLEAEAIHHNMSFGEATTEAFRLQVTPKNRIPRLVLRRKVDGGAGGSRCLSTLFK